MMCSFLSYTACFFQLSVYHIWSHLSCFFFVNFGTCLIFKPNDLNKTAYLYYWLTSPIMQEVFSAQTNGASQQFVGLTFMRNYKVLVPNDDILHCFGDKVRDMIRLKEQLNQKNQNLARQRDLLLPRLMSGKLEV